MSQASPPAGQGMVVLDIGGDTGALVVNAPEHLAGAEIEICPSGQRGHAPDEGVGWWQGEWRGTHPPEPGHSHEHSHDHADGHYHVHDSGPAWPHVAVLSRPTGTGSGYCAIYPGLLQGEYDLWVRPDGATALTVSIRGAEVTTADWPTESS
jgi:hypothetical protein